ncbi:hypothetical protein NEF87_003152 [Candidatus Lokiarchaeum ossiferum]|uniref:Tetratricopeptide repeat protein n=1 Tax=Candidatus Lokiarchaeum ossiferum TaxID=2951803 RepID=A0ABY6HWZ5_9ARCH|nr:hypothetical protein NEF87_003152 [Candidatus Lokiarchaeum sp. B-35]
MAQLSKDELSNITLFLAEWDEALGPTVKDYFNTLVELGDVDMIALNIFSTFQMVFGESTDVSFKRTVLTMPMNSQKVIARIVLDIIPDTDVRGGFMPFIVVILIPDFLPEDKISSFDEILAKIVSNYKEHHGISLSNYKGEILNAFSLAQQIIEDHISIDVSYSLTSAVDDFKKGVGLYKQKNWNTAYMLFRKALLKFQQDNQTKMVMEATYLISSILVQLKKFQPALIYYTNLVPLATEMSHQKYKELGLFMQGFCHYKMRDFMDAMDTFNQLPIFQSQFVNKVQYFSLKGQTQANLQMHQEAIESLSQASLLLSQQPVTQMLQKQHAQILNDLALQYYKSVISLLKTQGFFHHAQGDELQDQLKTAISYYIRAISLWDLLGDYKNSIRAHQMVGNIYGFLLNPSKQLDHLLTALDKVDQLNNYALKLNIAFQIVEIYESLKEYDAIIHFLQNLGAQLTNNAFVDLLSIAKIHFLIGKAFIAVDQRRNAAGELIMAINNLKKLKNPVPEELEAHSLLIELYKEEQDETKVAYYTDRFEKLQKKYHAIQPVSLSRLGVIKDFWVYTTSGLELFSHAPEIKFDPTLLGGFLTAMQSFSMELSQTELQSLVIGGSIYSFYNEAGSEFYILGRTKSNIPPHTIEAALQKIYHAFSKEFKADLVSFSGNTIAFRRFKDVLKQLDLSLI